MTTQTITEYLEEERQKASETQLRTDEEAARVRLLQSGRHHTAKRPKLELVPPVKTATRKKQKRKTATVVRKKPRAAAKKATKKATQVRKRA
jgi:hypothetical protein